MTKNFLALYTDKNAHTSAQSPVFWIPTSGIDKSTSTISPSTFGIN
jgi:hypothetical protein